MTIATNVSGVLTITGPIEVSTAPELLETLRHHLLNQPEIVLDLSGVDSCDTPALQILLAAKKNAEALKKPFRIISNSSPVQEISSALGLSLDVSSNF